MSFCSLNKIFNSFKNSQLFLYITAICIAITLVFVFGTNTFEHKGIQIAAGIKPAIIAKTVVNIPPFGQIWAKTHKAPIEITFTVNRISADEIKNLFSNNSTKEQIIGDFKNDIKNDIANWIIKLLALGTVGGFSAAILLKKLSIKSIAICGLIGFMSTFTLATLTIKTYDNKAFRQPKFNGMLSAAPWLLDAVQKKFETFREYKQQVRVMARNINKFQNKVHSWSDINLENETSKVLFISDIHNNTAGLDIARKAVKDFKIDFVIDAGDITDYGTPLEAHILARLAKFDVPYIFIPGNHDSQNVIDALQNQKNVIVLDNKGYSVSGMKIFGIKDPGATSETIDELPKEESKKLDKENYKALENMEDKPDILVVHNPEYAKSATSLVKVTLTGHTHVKKIEKKVSGNLIINTGSTGGAGIRGILSTKQTPLSFKILYFDKKYKKLVAVDAITFSSTRQEFSLQRTVLDNE